jgi:hypothetical protein
MNDTYNIELDRVAMQGKIEHVLESMQGRLKAYSSKADASPERINQFQSELLTIFRYLKVCHAVIQGLEKERQSAYNEGFLKGQQSEASKDTYGYRSTRERRAMLGNEAYRALSNSAQREKWADLY